MRALCLVIAIILLQGCRQTDGAMKQVGGVEINHAALDGLAEGQSTKSQALAALGRLDSRDPEGPGNRIT